MQPPSLEHGPRPARTSGPRVLRLRGDERLLGGIGKDAETGAPRLRIFTRERVRTGDRVRVEVSFGALADEVVLSGQVTEIESGEAPRVDIRIVAEHAERVRYVREVLSGDRVAAARSHRRVVASLSVRWSEAGVGRDGRISDLSRGGAFIVSDRPPQIGAVVDLDLDLGGAERLQVSSVVSWIRRAGTQPGFGVSFRLKDRDAAARLTEAVRRLES